MSIGIDGDGGAVFSAASAFDGQDGSAAEVGKAAGEAVARQAGRDGGQMLKDGLGARPGRREGVVVIFGDTLGWIVATWREAAAGRLATTAKGWCRRLTSSRSCTRAPR